MHLMLRQLRIACLVAHKLPSKNFLIMQSHVFSLLKATVIEGN